jgi:putative (di)nucleoside polyphosphate hydrolase
MQNHENYRMGVVGVFINAKKQILLGERSNMQGVWQFPQGGIDLDETPRQALVREMGEELGATAFVILKESNDWSQYTFPKNAAFELAKSFVGQRQIWYLCAFEKGAGPDQSRADGEFSAFKWEELDPTLAGIVEWKRPAYKHGLQMLGLL